MRKKRKNVLQKDITTEIIPELLELFRKKNINISRDQTERIAKKIHRHPIEAEGRVG